MKSAQVRQARPDSGLNGVDMQGLLPLSMLGGEGQQPLVVGFVEIRSPAALGHMLLYSPLHGGV